MKRQITDSISKNLTYSDLESILSENKEFDFPKISQVECSLKNEICTFILQLIIKFIGESGRKASFSRMETKSISNFG